MCMEVNHFLYFLELLRDNIVTNLILFFLQNYIDHIVTIYTYTFCIVIQFQCNIQQIQFIEDIIIKYLLKQEFKI